MKTRAVMALCALLPLRALAGEPAPAVAPAPAPAPASKKPDEPARRRVLKLEEVTVEGRIQKPQAFFILQRSNLSFDEAEKKESFLPKIQKSCEKDPF